MAAGLTALLEGWDGIGVVMRFDRETGTWIFIALHDDTLGPATGGTRMKVYPDPADGLQDAMRLARGMTHKWAGIDCPFGGGKAVLAVPEPMEGERRDGLLRRYGGVIESLRGTFSTGPDMGTTPRDMQVIAERTAHVHGTDPETGEKIDPGPYTALGVFAGIQSAVRHVFGSDDLTGRSVVVEGIGDVGAPLAKMLQEAGATLLLSDLDAARATDMANALDGATAVRADGANATACDVYAPCAVGATLNADTIPRLQCRIVAGSANNQLATDEDAERLHAREIVWAPDYVINAGGAAAFAMMALGQADDASMRGKVETIGDAMTAILTEARERDESPLHAAMRIVQRRLGEGTD